MSLLSPRLALLGMVGTLSRKKVAKDWLRLGLLTLLVIWIPLLLLAIAEASLEPYEHVGWVLHLVWSVPATLVVGLAMLAIGRWVCKESPLAPMALIYLVAAPVTAARSVGCLDVALTREPGRIVTVPLIRHVKRNRGANPYEFKSWHSDEDTVELYHSPHRGSLAPGALASFRVHRGGLGLEWVEPVGAP